MDQAETVRRLDGLPVGLAVGAEVVRPVQRGQVITWADVRLDEDSTLVKLRRQQDDES
jgi:predicted homoserine dehydrogenase-like protein